MTEQEKNCFEEIKNSINNFKNVTVGFDDTLTSISKNIVFSAFSFMPCLPDYQIQLKLVEDIKEKLNFCLSEDNLKNIFEKSLEYKNEELDCLFLDMISEKPENFISPFEHRLKYYIENYGKKCDDQVE